MKLGVGGLGTSLAGGLLDELGLLGNSCFDEEPDPRLGLLDTAHEVDGTGFELLGLELFGSGGTAYTVCFDT